MARTENRKRRKRLGELLLEARLITAEELQTALSRQREFGGRVGSHLIRIEAVTEDVLLEFLGRATGYPAVDLDDTPVDGELRDLISRDIAEMHLVVPVKRSSDPQSRVLTVAMADPTDLEFVDRLQFSTGHHIEPAIAMESAVLRFIRRLYQLGPVRSTRRDGFLQHIVEGAEQREVVSSGSTLPFHAGEAPWKRRFAALAELLIEKGVITREDLVAKMRKARNSRKG